ncbi:MAG TPA: hypothetical protein VHZ07_01130 [Bryobacteraceae bacterium]|jgi:hypothetical protein|nr:hypothetical protein [Bryobacteraceae bacterium]
MAETSKSQTIQLDGNHLVETLKHAGMDPSKLDLKKALPGAHVDMEELETRLKGTGAAKSGSWHVSVTISRD